MKIQIIDQAKELREMKAESKKVQNDKLKYPKVTGYTYPKEWKSPIPYTSDFVVDRFTLANEQARINNDNPLN